MADHDIPELAWMVVWRTDGSEYRLVREDLLETYTAQFPHAGPFDGPDQQGVDWTYYGVEAFGDPVTAALAAAHIAAGLVGVMGAIHPWRVQPQQLTAPMQPRLIPDTRFTIRSAPLAEEPNE